MTADLSLELGGSFHSHRTGQLAQEFVHLSVFGHLHDHSSQAVTCVRSWGGLTEVNMLHAKRPVFSVPSCCLLRGH